MPFDNTPQVENEDPFALTTLIKWLETKDPKEKYEYFDTCGGCCLGQYLKAKNVPFEAIRGDGFRLLDDTIILFSPAFANIPLAGAHTFGAALTRARSLLKKEE
jgi:hypothetical protein